MARGRGHGLLHPYAQQGIVVHPGVLTLQPAVPPAQALLLKADRWARLGIVGKGVRPRSDQPPAGRIERPDEPEHGIGVAIGPTADRVHRALDRRRVLAHRALLPVGVAPLVAHPLVHVGLHRVDALEPGLAPALAVDLGVGRHRVEGEHRGAPGEHLQGQHGAASVVDVVGVPIVGRAERYHGLELGRAQSGHLQRAEAAPGDPDHSAGTGAPGLFAEPAQHVHRVLLLLGRVFVLQQPVRLAAAANVHAHPRIAVTGDVGEARGVTRSGAIALAVGDVVHDGRHRAVLGVLGKPDACAHPAPVGKRDPDVLERPYRAGEVGDYAHQASSSRRCSSRRGAGTPRAVGAPLTLNTLPSRRTGPTVGWSTVCTRPLAWA